MKLGHALLIWALASTTSPHLSADPGDPAPRETFKCDRPWPRLDVFVPVHLQLPALVKREHDRNAEFVDFFLRTYTLFWPYQQANSTMRVLIDAERRTTPVFAAFEASVLAKLPHTQFSFIAESPWYNGNGGARQQYAMFWADNYTTPGAEFVAFADADTAFTTCIDREDLFEGGKPVINGRFGVESRVPWRGVPATTFAFTGLEEPMRCMSYFPVVLRVAHLHLIREHIRRHMKKNTFDEAFQAFGGYYSQFNIMCTVLFWTKELKDQYVWYVHDYSPDWDGFRNPTPNYGQWADRSIFTRSNPDMFQPKPRVAVHARWHDHWAHGAMTIYSSPAMMQSFLQRGVCDCPPFPRTQGHCRAWQEQGRVSYNSTVGGQYTGYNKEMHSFEFVDYYEQQNQSEIIRMHAERLRRLDGCNSTWPLAVR